LVVGVYQTCNVVSIEAHGFFYSHVFVFYQNAYQILKLVITPQWLREDRRDARQDGYNDGLREGAEDARSRRRANAQANSNYRRAGGENNQRERQAYRTGFIQKTILCPLRFSAFLERAWSTKIFRIICAATEKKMRAVLPAHVSPIN
jgi:hypothetical protein